MQLNAKKYAVVAHAPKGYKISEDKLINNDNYSVNLNNETWYFKLKQQDLTWWEGNEEKKDGGEVEEEKGKQVLLILDPQNDYHPAKGFVREKDGAFAVKGANEDSHRIAKMIRQNLNEISEIYVTLDTHNSYGKR